MLVPLPTLLGRAGDAGYAVGYFEAWDSYSLEAVLEAAELEQAPVILGFGCMMVAPAWLEGGGISALGCLGRSAAERAQVPVSLLLNEARNMAQVQAGLDAGFNAVMLDTSSWPYEQAVEQVARLVAIAHARGVAVEAELGRLPDAGATGIDAHGAALTDPAQAGRFVERTGVDCLAVSIGNVHLLLDGVAPIDPARLAAIHARVPVPLVIHGGSSFPAAAVPAAIASGVAKFNVGTVLKTAFLDGVQGAMAGWRAPVSAHDVLGSHTEADLLAAGKARMRDKIRAFMQLYGSSGRA